MAIGKMGSMPKVVDLGISIGDGAQMPYQDALEKGCCMYCKASLAWNLRVGNCTDDRFCFAECCGRRFWMVAKVVDIMEETISRPISKPTVNEEEEEGEIAIPTLDVPPFPQIDMPSIVIPTNIKINFPVPSQITIQIPPDKSYLEVPFQKG
jgi:hypothetical protein